MRPLASIISGEDKVCGIILIDPKCGLDPKSHVKIIKLGNLARNIMEVSDVAGDGQKLLIITGLCPGGGCC